ncbi:hypothetical protein DFH27DRAFT_584092 [Peziza echinospora]|nr:hypothetical protein DFH27DRAFT_584092 [Peziza echinospora]
MGICSNKSFSTTGREDQAKLSSPSNHSNSDAATCVTPSEELQDQPLLKYNPPVPSTTNSREDPDDPTAYAFLWRELIDYGYTPKEITDSVPSNPSTPAKTHYKFPQTQTPTILFNKSTEKDSKDEEGGISEEVVTATFSTGNSRCKAVMWRGRRMEMNLGKGCFG